MTQPLTPAAQAVLDAYLNAPVDNRKSVAAALRAAADQVVPDSEARSSHAAVIRGIRRAFLVIAAELEETSG